MELKVSKKFINAVSIGLATFAVATIFSGCGKRDNSKNTGNIIGHKDVGTLVFNVDPDDFVLLDAGNTKNTGTSHLERKIKLCNVGGVPVGLSISSTACTLDDVCDEVEILKGLLSKYTINMPVFINIDEIIDNGDLDVDQTSKLINLFLEKCSANGMYVGVMGIDSNLTALKKYGKVPLENYDAYLIMEQDDGTITYDGNFSIFEDLDGNVYATQDLSKIIEEKGLNNSRLFVNDAMYTFQEGDDIQEIAMKYGIGVNSLLEFNDLNKVKVGDVLRIPTEYGTHFLEQVSVADREYSLLETPQFGVDLSRWNGTDIDWALLSQKAKYVIFKVNQGNAVDKCFAKNGASCIEYNIPIGGYCYNNWVTKDFKTKETLYDINEFRAKQEEQAEVFLSALEEVEDGKKSYFPAYLDIEFSSGVTPSEVLTKEYLKVMLEVWCDKMIEAGRVPGIYTNQSGYNDLCGILGEDLQTYLNDKGVHFWTAKGKNYTSNNPNGLSLSTLEVPSSTEWTFQGKTHTSFMFQITEAGAGKEIGIPGYVDYNYCMVDYANSVKFKEENSPNNIKSIDRVDYGDVATTLSVVAAASLSTAGALVGYKVYKKRKQNKMS